MSSRRAPSFARLSPLQGGRRAVRRRSIAAPAAVSLVLVAVVAAVVIWLA